MPTNWTDCLVVPGLEAVELFARDIRGPLSVLVLRSVGFQKVDCLCERERKKILALLPASLCLCMIWFNVSHSFVFLKVLEKQ
jgi:hypothetical protein